MKSLFAARQGARVPFSIVAVFALAALALACIAPPALARPGGGTGWTSATAISPTNQPDSRGGSQLNAVAVNANGLAIAAWDQFTYAAGGGATIGAAVQSAGRWSAPFTISGATGYSMSPSVAVGAEGTAAVSWTYQDPVATTPSPQQKIQVAVKRPSDPGWTTFTLDQGPVGGVAVVLMVPVGVDRYGNVTAAWTLWDGVRHVVKAATLIAGETSWRPSTMLSGSDDGLYIDLAVHPDGYAAVAYSLSPYTSYAIGTSVKVSSTALNGSWSAPTVVSETMPSSVGYVTSPRIALHGAGLATVVYFGNGIRTVRQLADGNWTPPVTVILASYSGSSYMSPDIAVDDSGNAVVAASIFDATVGVDRASVWVVRGTPDGKWTAQQRLTDPAVAVDAYSPRVAVAADGTLAMVGWIDHYHGEVQVSRWNGSAWGAADTIGRGTAAASFQEVLGLDVGSGSVGAAVWKSTVKGGTRTMASSYRK